MGKTYYLFLVAFVLCTVHNVISSQSIYERPVYDHKWAIDNHLLDVSDTLYTKQRAAFYCGFVESNTSLFYEDTGITYSTNGSYMFSHQGDTIPGSDSLAYHPSQGADADAWIYFGPGPDLSLMLPGFETDSFSLFTITAEKTDEDGAPFRGDFLPNLHQTKLVRTNTFPYAEVVEKKNLVFSDTLDQGLSAVRHGNGRDWWIILNSRTREEQHVLLYDIYGLHHVSTQDFSTSDDRSFGSGKSLFSPSGELYAKIKYSNNLAEHWQLIIYQFDRCSGNLTPFINYTFPEETPPAFAELSLGLAFSSNSRFLYFSETFGIHQFDLQSENIIESQVQVFDFYNQPDPAPGDLFVVGEYLGLTPNGEIIAGSGGSNRFFHKIINANQRADSSSFIWKGITGLDYTDGYLPNFPHYSVGPLDGSPCDTLGIDYPPPSAEYEYVTRDSTLAVEFYNVSSIYAESWFWSFGDGQNSGNEHVDHTYEAEGVYEVCLSVTALNGSDINCKTIYVGVEPPNQTVDFHEVADFQVYPNPASNKVSVVPTDNLNGDIYLIDIYGRVLESKATSGSSATIINLESYSSGVYFLVFTHLSGYKVVKKISKI